MMAHLTKRAALSVLVRMLCTTACLALLVGAGANVETPSLTAGPGDGQWVERYEASRSDRLAEHGQAVLDEYRSILDSVDASKLDEQGLAILRDNALIAAERNVRQRLRATEAEVPDERPIVRYAVIPIEGQFFDGRLAALGVPDGPLVLAEAVEAAIADAADRQVQHIVFVIDSSGGHILPANRIAAAMQAHRDRITYHAVIKEAGSAAVAVAFNAHRWYLHEDASMGAALAYTDSNGHEDVEAKRLSWWEGGIRAAAQAHGHSPLLSKAMIVPGTSVVGWLDAHGRPHISASREEVQTNGEIVFESAGERVLTVTGAELLRLGLAEPFVEWRHHPPMLVDEGIRLHRAIRGGEVVDRVTRQFRRDVAREQREQRDREELIAELNRSIPQWRTLIQQRVADARNAEPRNFTYAYDPATMRLTGASQRAWQQRTDEAIAKWEAVLDGCHDLADELELAEALELGVGEKWQWYEENVVRAKQAIQELRDDRRRRRIDGM